MKSKTFIRQFLAVALLLFAVPVAATAQNSSSSSYQVHEAQFGSGGIEEQCSGGQYCAQGSLGANAVGRQSSANFDAEAGVLTQNEEFLEFVVLDTQVNLGVLTPSVTGTGTADFYIRSYLSSGYVLYSLAPSPTAVGGESLDPLLTPSSSTQGTEQFGINLVDNTSPDIGSNFVNTPDDSFADGTISAGYDTPDLFKYVDGDPLVAAPETAGNQGTGRSDFTVSYIANVSALTPAGTYLMNHNLVVVPIY